MLNEAHKKEYLEIFTFQIAKNKGANQTAWMCRLACAFVFRKQQSQGFLHFDVEAQASWPPSGYAPACILCPAVHPQHFLCA